MNISIAKRFANLPFAHRQHNHDGHCRLVHGHNWDFELEFECNKLDENQFVVDFGKLKFIRQWLEERFDHTLVLNADDPHLEYLKKVLNPKFGPNAETNPPTDDEFAKIVVLPNGGAEGLAVYCLVELNKLLESQFGYPVPRGLRIKRVTVFEDEKNSATAEHRQLIADAIRQGGRE
jgi:6-pyruvoyltetrahydropterin/6-carboxytetrahydropterin synthase